MTAAARLARAARWTVRPALPDERDLKGFLLSQPTEDQPVLRQPDPAAAARVRSTHQAEFTRPFIAHASMAPSCAIARWDSDPGGAPRITRVDAQPGAVPAAPGAGRRAGPGPGPADRAPRGGRGRVRAQRLGRRGGRRGAAGPAAARPPGAGALVPRGRARLGTGGPGHAGPAVGRPGRVGPDPGLAAGRVEQRLPGPAGHRRRAAAARPVPAGWRGADPGRTGWGAQRGDGRHPQRGARPTTSRTWR